DSRSSHDKGRLGGVSSGSNGQASTKPLVLSGVEGPARTEMIESIPVEIEELAELSPLLRTMYLLEQGLAISREGERLVVSRDAAEVSEIPVQKLDQLVMQGNGMISTAALRLLAENDIGVYFADWRGQCWGALDAFDTRSTELNALQYGRAQDANSTLNISRAIVAGKIANCRLVLRRYARNHELVDAELRDLEQAAMQHAAGSADTLDAVRGHEGMAARIYFSALSDLLPEAWQFDKRTRQPPLDPVNAMLSYGYAVLFANIKTLIRRRGLDPHVGNLHALRDGHAALASDLMEEFRPLIIDATVLQLIFKQSVKPEDFVLDDQAEQPCRLTDAGRKKLIHALEAKFNAPLTHPLNGQRADWRRLMQYQVWHYARVLQGEEEAYQPCVMR
ncbi:MAG: CRISPR-associated endonuclease Cas1, partial [Sulfuricella sp.]